jgi:hypothetical protein
MSGMRRGQVGDLPEGPQFYTRNLYAVALTLSDRGSSECYNLFVRKIPSISPFYWEGGNLWNKLM